MVFLNIYSVIQANCIADNHLSNTVANTNLTFTVVIYTVYVVKEMSGISFRAPAVKFIERLDFKKNPLFRDEN